MKRFEIVFISLGFATLLKSCSTFKETHYFKDKPLSINQLEEQVPNYYKVNIKGKTFLSSSRYLSGYFDPNIVSLYFNEFKQPQDGRIFPVVASTGQGENPSTSSPANETGTELVLLLSSNSKSVMDQIGNLTKNQEMLNSLATLTQKKEIDESLQIQQEINLLKTQNEFLKKIIDSGISEINSETDPEKKKEKLFNLIRNLRMN